MRLYGCAKCFLLQVSVARNDHRVETTVICAGIHWLGDVVAFCDQPNHRRSRSILVRVLLESSYDLLTVKTGAVMASIFAAFLSPCPLLRSRIIFVASGVGRWQQAE